MLMSKAPVSQGKQMMLASLFYCSINVFTVTCGRTGVDSVTSIDLRIVGDDGWRVEWVEIGNGLETFTITCDFELDDSATQRFYR